jgi:hypothetical protein
MSNRNPKSNIKLPKHKKLCQAEETIVENLTVNNAETVQAEETIAENLTVNNAETAASRRNTRIASR